MIKTVNISLESSDLEAIDKYCLAHNLTRSKFMLQSTIQALEVERLANATRLLYQSLDKFRETGKVDREGCEELERLETLIRGYGINV